MPFELVVSLCEEIYLLTVSSLTAFKLELPLGQSWGRNDVRLLTISSCIVQILAVHLLNEAAKGKSSTWSPYLIHLPRIYHTLPYFVANDVQALQVLP